jgi:CO dehydrogenase/acetyl-CoA synthase epsilon subunit
LFDKRKTLLHRVVCRCHDINVEIILIEPIENDLDVALSHNLVNLTVLLAADEFFVLIGELNLDTNLILGLRHKFHL